MDYHGEGGSLDRECPWLTPPARLTMCEFWTIEDSLLTER